MLNLRRAGRGQAEHQYGQYPALRRLTARRRVVEGGMIVGHEEERRRCGRRAQQFNVPTRRVAALSREAWDLQSGREAPKGRSASLDQTRSMIKGFTINSPWRRYTM